MTRPLAYASLALLLAACGSGEDEPNTTDDATSTTTGPAEEEPFGFVCASIRRAQSVEADPFVGTAQIRLTLKYDQCLIDYYDKRHPEHRFDAAEGAAIVEEWRERLCSESVDDPLVGCEVAASAQTFDEDASKFEMAIIYRIADPTQIDGRVLLWGPGPVDATAECEAGQLPSARMTLPTDLVGLDAGGAPLWNAQSWSMPQSVFKSDALGCIEVDAGPV
ncbi:hypothetical protein OV203_18315 [Nannocystis sp. ILAH1]|uniref:hypothetical protein n=1 Tax=unclassified Nannocystis TaxID=2627009 RepID=UPI00226FC45D|nr:MULTISPECIES: hypothetical protein [unclassified Nannocystis]MCY0989097.1 hypothetical protein [Nannocystis sp. ILAH1]MCY1067970.1 hypothetical protein [Nannocystis sp. RBIL2]